MSKNDRPRDWSVPVREGLYSLPSFTIHGRHRTARWDFDHHVVPPMSASSTYRLDSSERGALGFCDFPEASSHDFKRPPILIYDRLDEPVRAMLEDRLAFVEGGQMGVAFATGMGAICAAQGVLISAGQHILAHQVLYGCTYSLLTNWWPRFGVSSDYVDMTDPANVARAIRPETRVVYFETPVNPTLDLIDIQAVVRVAKQVNSRRPPEERVSVVVDNTFATPYCQRPLELGVDLVVHSLTKGLGGFGTDMGGVVIGSKRHESDLLLFRKDFGAALSSRSAWPLLVYGIPTLELRMRRQAKSAARVAEYLSGRPEVERVVFPGREDFRQRELYLRQMRDFEGNPAPGSLIYFVLKGSAKDAYERGKALVDDVARNAYTLTLAVSLGQIRTLIEMPSSMTHAVVPEEAKAGGGIDPGGIRLSVGIESPEDIIRDLEACFARIG